MQREDIAAVIESCAKVGSQLWKTSVRPSPLKTGVQDGCPPARRRSGAVSRLVVPVTIVQEQIRHGCCCCPGSRSVAGLR